MRYVCLIALGSSLWGGSLLWGQDGASLYGKRCASCHDNPAPRVPSLSTIRKMSGEAIYGTLTRGVMQSQAQGLTPPELFALIAHIGPEGNHQASTPEVSMSCKAGEPVGGGSMVSQGGDWSAGLNNTRLQPVKSAGFGAADVAKLKLRWAFHLGDVTEARSQPVVAGGRVYLGSMTGAFYALDVHTGCTYWTFQAAGPIRGGAAVGEAKGASAVFFGDAGANLYALDARTGKLIWKVRPSEHFASLTTAAPRYYKGVVYQGFSSFEEFLAGDPKYACCTFRGSVVALDAGTGEKRWQTYTIADSVQPTGKNSAETQQMGPSGAGVWVTPTIDERKGVLYVSTGDNYSDPPTAMSDAALAMDLKSGELVWSAQLTSGDAFNNGCAIPIPGNCPKTHGSDFDFGQPPILVDLGGGKRALVLAQKSGMVHAIDPDAKGKVLWQTRAGAGGSLGGSQWGSAADETNIYVAISDIGMGGVPDAKAPNGFRFVLDPKKGGGLHALDLHTGKMVWSAPAASCEEAKTDCSPAQSAAVSMIPGVVFSGAVDGHLRAYSTASGKVVWDVDTAREFQTVNGKPAHGGSIDVAGPAMAEGMLIVNSGFGQWGGKPGNVLLAFSPE